MKVLVVGGGGREHTLVWKLAQSERVTKIYCAPGNAGTAQLATNLNLQASDIDGLATLAEHEEIDLTIVGPEVPLVSGIVDRFEAKGLKIFGPDMAAARLEGSKSFTKDILFKYNIPTAASQEFGDYETASQYLSGQAFPQVIKADGLAAGKGVYVCEDLAAGEAALNEIFTEKRFGSAGAKIIIEDFLEGEEASVLVISDSKTYVTLASAQDHKAAYEGDTGPNTGGMGAYSPAPVITEEMSKIIDQRVWKPLFEGLRAEGIRYKGVLYAGLMIKDNEPYVLEFNVRFGDPETQVILPRLESDLLEVLLAVCEERLAEVELKWSPTPAVCVVLAAAGYPGDYEKGAVISGLDQISDAKVTVLHAGTKAEAGRILTNGGRVLGVCARGTDLKDSIERAYAAIELINYPGKQFRRDIAHRALKRLT